MTRRRERAARRKGVFNIWQPRYAERGIATFPVRFVARGDNKIDKVPAVTNYMKFGLRGSTELTRKFADADGIGFALGTRNGIAVVDIDTPEENVVADVMKFYGSSPLIARSPSGGHHIYYRHNGQQRRRVRDPYWLDRGAPVDVLANGFIVAPPSRSSKGAYEFVQGVLDDVAQLRIMRGTTVGLQPAKIRPDKSSPLHGLREHDGRNDALFRAIGPIAREIHRASGTREQLLQIAMEHNQQCSQPMENAEVNGIVDSVWRMTLEDRNYIGVRELVFFKDEHLELDPYALKLLMFVRRHQGPHATFWCTNSLASQFEAFTRLLPRTRYP